MYKCFGRLGQSGSDLVLWVLLTAFGLFLLASPPDIAAQDGAVNEGITINTAAKFDVSPPLRSIKPDVSTKVKKADDDKGADGPVNDTRHTPDRALQSALGVGVFSSPELIPPPLANFAGMGGNGSTPPDPNGDIGPNHYIQTVNARFQIFNRAGVSMFGPSKDRKSVV